MQGCNWSFHPKLSLLPPVQCCDFHSVWNMPQFTIEQRGMQNKKVFLIGQMYSESIQRTNIFSYPLKAGNRKSVSANPVPRDIIFHLVGKVSAVLMRASRLWCLSMHVHYSMIVCSCMSWKLSKHLLIIKEDWFHPTNWHGQKKGRIQEHCIYLSHNSGVTDFICIIMAYHRDPDHTCSSYSEKSEGIQTKKIRSLSVVTFLNPILNGQLRLNVNTIRLYLPRLTWCQCVHLQKLF